MYCKVAFDVPLDRYFDYAVPDELAGQVRPGIRVTAPFGPMQNTGLIVSVSEDISLQENIVIKPIGSVLDEKPLFGSDLFTLAQFMKQTWGGSIGQNLFALVPPQDYFKLLDPVELPPLPSPQTVNFTDPAQQAVFHTLQQYLTSGFHQVLLSGSDSQLQLLMARALAEQVLQNYGQSLLTVPDVLAAQQLATRLQKTLGTDYVLCWHSKMLLSRKKQIFSRISSGQPCLVISARSGGLLPFKNLRLAVMLEEESENYKQEENKPYFHLRDILAFRCRQHEALFVQASDTPSLEVLHAVEQGSVEMLHLPAERVSLPIKITGKKSERSPLFSNELIAALGKNLLQKQASLLILNRRGYANVYFCLNCGAYAKCSKCGTILCREKTETEGDRLVCRKCGHTEPIEQTCPKCQNKIFKSRGGGTQKIVTEINELWPTARVLRLDSDTLAHKDGQGHTACQELEAGQADIVVGTRQALEAAQIQRVTLAAILDADLELDSPDFRASERFGQLLFKLKNKLAPRPQSQFIVQVSSTDIYPFETLSQSYTDCAQMELAARESFAYPPYVCLVKVLLKAKDPALLQTETARVMSVAAPLCTEILGPVQTGKKTDTLKKQYLLCKTTTAQYGELVQLLDTLKPAKKTELKVFADPYDFY